MRAGYAASADERDAGAAIFRHRRTVGKFRRGDLL